MPCYLHYPANKKIHNNTWYSDLEGSHFYQVVFLISLHTTASACHDIAWHYCMQF